MTAPARSPLEPLLETWEDAAASPGEQTDAYLTLTSRMSGEEGKEVIIEIEKNLPRLFKALKAHISSQNSELCSAALQALGFCLYNPKITSGLSETNIQELLLKLNGIIKNSDKNICTRALWVVSKQTFPTEVVGKMVPNILDALEALFNKGEIHSAVVDFEALNVIIRLIEQTPVQMAEESVRWAKLVIPLVVHSAQKVHLRGATALEMGMPLLLQKQQEIASITEHLMTTKLISELQKLFTNKNETYVLKLWPLFVKLLGKTLHRSGSFINSLLQLEELGFRSGTPVIKKIAFIAWKSLIDNFALNPDILCSTKRLKLLMQPLSSIHVRTETLALTKLEVWWYLLTRLGPHLSSNFEQVCAPLIQSTISIDTSASPQGNSSRVSASPGLNTMTPVHKGASTYGVPTTPRMNQSPNVGGMAAIPSIQLLGLEMLLHFLLGPEVLSFAKQHKLVLSLEPLEYPLISSPSFFSKHANTLISAVHDSFVAVGRDASDAVVSAIWKELISLVKSVTEAGNKKERPGSEVLTLLLKSLESIVKSEIFSVSKILVFMEITIRGLPQKVLGSPAYQVANMDILNGTPALFLVQLIFNSNLLESGVADERFFLNLETLVHCVLSGPTSPLAFSDSVLNVINQNAKQLENKEHLWRMWNIIVTPLTDLINQTNEVNQGDALEHNFSAICGALTLPINHIFSAQTFPMATMKTLLKTWSELYRAFSRCAALVATAEENLCCEELCSKIISSLEEDALSNVVFLDRIAHILTVMVDCIDFSPYNVKYQPQIRSPQRSSDWSKKKEPLGKLTTLLKLIVRVIHSFHTLSLKEMHSDTLLAIGNSITSMLSSIFGHISLPSIIRKIIATLTRPLTLLYENSKCDEIPKVYSYLNNKLEKLLGEIIGCLQFNYTGSYDSELLEQLSPLLCVIFLHKNKQIRKQSALFWNATFAKMTVLVYPEELKPILRQAKQKFLLLLPGLENVEMMEEESDGPYLDTAENSQLNVKISGMERKSSGKRDSFLAQTKDKKENVKPSAKLKLESSSPKVKSDMLLEEEKSTDFVFIPPEEKEAKERILTEHQKEVLKTKRYDIPALYNNLDVSQDTLFTSQFSQEESMESPMVAEKPMEDSKMIMTKEEQMEDNIFGSQDATKNCGMDEHLEKASLLDDCGSISETSPEIPNINNGARKNTVISSTKMSTEHASVTESSLVVSSSSVSDATVSGTPTQPTSRRQSFITLEKFDVSENRPFSPSPLDISSSVTVRNDQETTIRIDTPPKTRKREETHSKSDSEKSVIGIKRSGRRWGKAEQSGNKRYKSVMKSEQEDHAQSSEGMVALENNPPDLLSEAESVPFSQDHLSESTMECEDEKPKLTVEKTLLENTATEEKNISINLESKENTPPVAPPADHMANEESHVTPTSNPKTLRRSSRRRSEIEPSPDHQDKESSQQKRERRKEEEKVAQKSSLHLKDKLPRQKATCEQNVKENLNEKGNNLHEKTFGETSANAEIEQNKRKPDADNISSEGDCPQDIVEKLSEKPVRGRTRYQTRRASQGLLSSIENSESDSSEAKEEGPRKKRSGKWKNKSSGSVDIEEQEEKTVEECTKIKNVTQDCKTTSEVDTTSQVCEKGESNTVIQQDSVVSSDSVWVSDVPIVYEENKKTSKCVDPSFASPPVPESNLRTRNASKRLQKRESDNSGGECSKVGTPDISMHSEKCFQTLECQHKRSRRVRRSKGCDCCGEKSQPQERSLTGLRNTENYDVKNFEVKNVDVQVFGTLLDTSEDNLCSETKFVGEHCSENFHLGPKEENDTINDLLIASEAELKENIQKSSLEVGTTKEETCNTDSSEAVPEVQELCDEKYKADNLYSGDSKDVANECFLFDTKENPEPTSGELHISNEGNVCQVIDSSPEEIEAMELDIEGNSDTSFFEKESAQTIVSEEMTTEESKRDEFETDPSQVNAEETTTEQYSSWIGPSDNTALVNKNAQAEISDQTEGRELKRGNNEPDSDLCEEMNDGMENYQEAMIQVNMDIDSATEENTDKTTEYKEAKVGRSNVETIDKATETETEETGRLDVEAVDKTAESQATETERSDVEAMDKTAESEAIETERSDVEATNKTTESEADETERSDVEAGNFVPDTLEMNTEEGKMDSSSTEANIELKSEETKINDNQIIVGNDILQEVQLTSEKVEEFPQFLTSETTVSELETERNNASPEKLRELDPLFVSANESPSGIQGRCVWSPLASPSTSILKRGLKRSPEDEITSSPVNKVRRVSFADPIYQAGLADDIDRRCSVVRSHFSNSSLIIKSVKTSPISQFKHNTTSAKGFLSPGSRSSKFKSSKKCLITEMSKESMLSPAESVYPALVNCSAPVDIILPQITSNMWARGLGQLIRAKNIKTIGDLSTLTASEIKTLPIRSPKVSNVKKALRVYHEQQVKSRGLEEIPVFDISEKVVNGVESKPLSTEEERLASDLIDPVTLEAPLPTNLVAQISALALQLDSEDLCNYSGSQLFEMHEKLGSMANSIIKNLQSRWKSPAHENSI